jgi:hypothetical protein
MLLKRKEKDGKIKVIYESSNILASTYDTVTQDLTIIFKAGTQYKYAGVSKADYFRFEIADSQGAVFSSHIKKYLTTKLDAINPELIIEEVNKTKDDDAKALVDALVKKIITDMTYITDKSADLSIDVFGKKAEEIKKDIEKYFELKNKL